MNAPFGPAFWWHPAHETVLHVSEEGAVLCISPVSPNTLVFAVTPTQVWAVSLLPLLPHFDGSLLQAAEYKRWSMVYIALHATVPSSVLDHSSPTSAGHPSEKAP